MGGLKGKHGALMQWHDREHVGGIGAMIQMPEQWKGEYAGCSSDRCWDCAGKSGAIQWVLLGNFSLSPQNFHIHQ